MAAIKKLGSHSGGGPRFNQQYEIMELTRAIVSPEVLVKSLDKNSAGQIGRADNDFQTRKKLREWVAVNISSLLNTRSSHPSLLGINKIQQHPAFGIPIEIEMRLGRSSAETKDQIECKNPDTKLQAVVEDLTNNSFRLTIMESDNDNSKIVWSKIGKFQ